MNVHSLLFHTNCNFYIREAAAVFRSAVGRVTLSASMAGGSTKKKGHGKYHDLALTVTAVLVISGVMMLQILARRLKRWSERSKHANDILEASERELSVLGLIAFGLFVMEQTALVAQGDWVAVFHEVHFALFTVALFYVIVNVMLYGLSQHFSKLWVGFEDADMADHWSMVARMHRLRTKLEIPALDHHLFFGSFWIKGVLRHPMIWFEYQRTLEHMTFHEVRRDFLRVHHLPHSFSFADYLDSCMQHVCLEFSEIRDAVWFIGILGLVVHLFFSTLLGNSEVSTSLTWLGLTVAGLGLLVFVKVKWIYWFILHSEILYRAGEDDEDDLLSPQNPSSPALTDVRRGEDNDTGEPTRTKDARQHQALRDAYHNAHQRLFWFGNPGLVVTLLETCLFVLSGTIALLVYKVDKLLDEGTFVAPFVSIIGATCLLLYLLPRIVPRFTLITHVGDMSDPRRIAEVVRIQQERGDFSTNGRLSRGRRRDREFGNAGSLRVSCGRRLVNTIRDVVDAPGISPLSAILSVAYAFFVAVTLNEQGARSVFDGHVLVLRDVELVLGALFVAESLARLFVAPKEISRQLDAALVVTTVSANAVSFALMRANPNLALSLHAFSAFLVFRVVTTMWHQELREVRFEHLRFSPDDLKARGGGGAVPAASAEPPEVLVSPQRHSHLPAWIGFYTPPVGQLVPPPPATDEDDDANWGMASSSAASMTTTPKIRSTVSQQQLAPIVESGSGDPKRRARDLVLAALAEVTEESASDSARSSSEDVVELALERALGHIRGSTSLRARSFHASCDTIVDLSAHGESNAPSLSRPQLSSLMSTHVEELEYQLYFNRVLRHCVATKSKTRKKRSISNSVFSSVDNLLCAVSPALRSSSSHGHLDHDAEAAHDPRVWHKVKLLLTRDQLVWYALDGFLSELLPGSGMVRDVPAETASPNAIALDDPGTVEPLGRVHLSTILRIDIKRGLKELACVTTTHIFTFCFDDDPEDWKRALLDAIDQEDDDDPIHPLMTLQRKSTADLESMHLQADLFPAVAGESKGGEDEVAGRMVSFSIDAASANAAADHGASALHVEDLIEEVKEIERSRCDNSG